MKRFNKGLISTELNYMLVPQDRVEIDLVPK